MHFKHPEFLYFLFLLLIPIVVHLFQLRRFKKEYFTNVRFLQALSIQSRKSSTLKKWLLLACRCLLLTALILAFAQPFFESKDSKNANNELYIVLDNSYSMQAKGKKGELLKRAVQDLLEHAPEQTTFSLLTNTENFWNTDIKTITNALQNLEYSATPFNAEALLSQIKARKSAFKKDIVIITDAVDLDVKALKSVSKYLVPLFIIPEAEQKTNVSIDSVFIKKAVSNFYEISVEISNYGSDMDRIPVALYNENKLIAKTSVTLKGNKQSIPFTIPKQAFHGYASISDDGLAYDNTYYFSIAEMKKVNVLSIGDESKSEFLSRIYTAPEFSFRNSTLSALDYNSIEEQNAIVLNEIDAIPQALSTTLQSFINKGGSVILIPAADTKDTNAFLAKVSNIQLTDWAKNEKQITKINFDHPVFNAVFEEKITNFQFPKTKASFKLSSNNPSALWYEDQSAFLTAVINPVGVLAVFAAPLNTENSNFQQSPLIVPTFYKLATLQQSNGSLAQIIGNDQPHITPVTLSKDAILEVKGPGEPFIPVQQILSNKVKMRFTEYPQQAGNFRIYNKKQWIENISFNYNRNESDLSQTNQNAASDFDTESSIESFFDALQTNRTDNQIWKWFAIFALLLALTEMAIIRFVK